MEKSVYENGKTFVLLFEHWTMLVIFAAAKYVCGMEYKKFERHIAVCLECGDQIRYGRADKKFCCDDCRSRHYNEKTRQGRAFRRRVLSALSRNYEILDNLIKADVASIDIIALSSMGFSLSLMTSYRKRGKHDECGCFDIRYIKTSTRIYSISKIQNFD